MHQLEWLVSSKGRGQAMIDLHLFRIIRRMSNGRAYWRCVQDHCVVTAITEDQLLVRVNGEHSHPIDEARECRRLYLDQCKAAIHANPTTPIPLLVNQQNAAFLQSATTAASDSMHLPPSFQSIQSSLYREKRRIIPPQPSLVTDLELSGAWSQTVDGRHFILADDAEQGRIIVFGTRAFLARLCAGTNTTIFMDGTFRVTPSIFAQIYIVHCLFGRQMVAVAYGLLPDK